MELIAESSIIGIDSGVHYFISDPRAKVALWVTVGDWSELSRCVRAASGERCLTELVVDICLPAGSWALWSMMRSWWERVFITMFTTRGCRARNCSDSGCFRGESAVIFAVLTTIVAFAPWLFLSGVTAQFTRQLSVVITLALLFSLIEAFLILPSHLSAM